MKIRYFSDIHLEFHGEMAPLPSIGEDLVVLAGDIAIGVDGIHWAKRAFAGRPVIYVLGNHEFYGSDFADTIREARAAAAGSNVHFLENDVLEFQGCRILGCTLWTDFECYGIENKSACVSEALSMMQDYVAITSDGVPLAPGFTEKRCAESRAWLDDQIGSASMPLIIVTHHAPVLATFNPRFEGELSDAAFHNHWPELFRPPVALWIHGHNHWCTEKSVNGIPVVTNQRGYPDEHLPDFSWDRMIEVLS